MSFLDALAMYYSLIVAALGLAGALGGVYLLAEHIGRDVPRWGQE